MQPIGLVEHRILPLLYKQPIGSLPYLWRLSRSKTRGYGVSRRNYAQPSKIRISTKVAFKPPPAPPNTTGPVTVEDGHAPGEAIEAAGAFDDFLARTALNLRDEKATSVQQLYAEYHERGGRMCEYVVPYQESPKESERADRRGEVASACGDGMVMVVHASFKPDGKLDKICACSGFVVDVQVAGRGEERGEVVITCAHTLEEMNRNIKSVKDVEDMMSMSFVVSSIGQTRRVQQVLSSMPKSDVIALQLEAAEASATLRLGSLPISPFPVDSGAIVLTHLFGAPEIPEVFRSQSRLPASSKSCLNEMEIEKPIRWLGGQAWRRWGTGTMLGYRSYTNIEVEAGLHSSLPHILTSILPTPGSSGGPLVNAETGTVVGMISGRRMDNRVEGERGWGASSESIFEMFSLPGFVPTGTDGT